jgi:hypothetical protein
VSVIRGSVVAKTSILKGSVNMAAVLTFAHQVVNSNEEAIRYGLSGDWKANVEVANQKHFMHQFSDVYVRFW